MLKFTTGKAESLIIMDIAKRAKQLWDDTVDGRMKKDRSVLDFMMDVSVVHANQPLRLDALKEADDANFAHDVFGIYRHLDRTTGELGDCFLPRYTA